MRYEFDTETAAGLNVAQLMHEEIMLEEIFKYVRIVRRNKEQVAADEAKARSEVARSREKGKKTGVWVNKGVAARRATAAQEA